MIVKGCFIRFGINGTDAGLQYCWNVCVVKTCITGTIQFEEYIVQIRIDSLARTMRDERVFTCAADAKRCIGNCFRIIPREDMRSQSNIFTDKELEVMGRRVNGNYTDPTGLFSRRIRPKLKEILAWSSPILKARLKKLLIQKRKRDEDEEPPQQTREESVESFRQRSHC